MENEMNQQDRELLIRIDQNLINLTKEVGEVKGMLSSHENRIREGEIDRGNNNVEIATLKNEVEKLRANGNLKDFIIGLGTIIVGVVTVIK